MTDRIAYLEARNAWLEKATKVSADTLGDLLEVLALYREHQEISARDLLASHTAKIQQRRQELGEWVEPDD